MQGRLFLYIKEFSPAHSLGALKFQPAPCHLWWRLALARSLPELSIGNASDKGPSHMRQEARGRPGSYGSFWGQQAFNWLLDFPSRPFILKFPPPIPEQLRIKTSTGEALGQSTLKPQQHILQYIWGRQGQGKCWISGRKGNVAF